MPPAHLPLRRTAAILSRVRSEMISRSNWAKDNRMWSTKRPMEVAVLNCWVTETKATWCSEEENQECHSRPSWQTYRSSMVRLTIPSHPIHRLKILGKTAEK